jgi:UDP-N-acetylmuramoyl-tripeptide--D-alanyl-D-alanine ligase
MMAGTLAKAAESLHGTLHGDDLSFRGVSTDTRSLQPGELFIALQGPNFDGAKFVRQAEERKAAGAIVQRPVETDLPTIVVDDTLAALGVLAASWRRQMPATVVGITGSNGKTTLKELLASCLSISDPTLATHGNLNNEIGVPLMLSRMGENHRYAVIEMGANHPGEIAYLTSLALPSVVAITNAAPAHLEGFGSVEGVARAKGEIIVGEEDPECVILNADDDYFEYWSTLVGNARVLSFGLSAEAEVRASGIEAVERGSAFTMHMPESQFSVTLALQGKHNVLNACAAAAIARSLGISDQQIQMGLEAVQPFHGRLQPVISSSGAMLFDDSYNANPVSVQAAADFLATQEGATWLVLGDMAELGGDGALLHAHTGWVVRESGVAHLLATGQLSKNTVDAFGDNGRWYKSIDDLVDELQKSVGEGDVVLVKGSRSMGMERVVEALTDSLDKVGSG